MSDGVPGFDGILSTECKLHARTCLGAFSVCQALLQLPLTCCTLMKFYPVCVGVCVCVCVFVC